MMILQINQFYKRWGKLFIDLSITIPVLIVITPIIAIIAFLIWINMGNPIIYRQKRTGLGRKPFTIYKFRTMADARDTQGNLFPDTVRLTHIGRFLRRYSLDELPELINVLLGDMSLVGPRPLLMRYVPYFRKEELVRFKIRPGITGLAQAEGRNDISWDTRFRLDAEYVKNISFFNDIRILCLTIVRVIRRKGLQVDPGSVMMDLDKERETGYLR